MPVDAKEDRGDLVHLEVRGELPPTRHAALAYSIIDATQRHHTIRRLVTLAGFEGSTPDDAWADA